MTSPDSWDLAQDRTDAARCMEASILLCGRPLTAVTAARTMLALGQLLNAVSLALAVDGRSVPPPVRRAALRVADQLQRPRSASSSGDVAVDDNHAGPSDRRSAQRRRSDPWTTRTGPPPYASSTKLSRMG